MSGRLGLEESPLTLALFAWLTIAAPVAAQERDDRDLDQRASFIAGVSLGDGERALATSATLAFRLTSRLDLEFELAHARKLDFTLELCPAPRVCVSGGEVPVTGRTVSLVPHLVVNLLPSDARVRVYVQAGVGAGHVRQRYFPSPLPRAPDVAEHTRSNVTLAWSGGGGVTVDLARRLALGVDVRSLHLLDEDATPDRFITPAGRLSAVRVGSRISWRF
jgi:hypothetical protein